MIVCKNCGHQNPDGLTFCESCKSFLEWTGERAEPTNPTSVLTLSLPASSLPVVPGGEATYEVKVRNSGTIVDEAILEVTGPAAAWTSVEPNRTVSNARAGTHRGR